MSSTPYSFIDVAILDGVRERFASGDAIVILSADLDELIWANGPGALLFGHEDIEEVSGAESGLSHASKRQITSTAGYPRIGSDRGVVLRLARGMESRAYAFLASEIVLPDGEEAIMLAIPAGLGAREEDIAERAIGGFSEPGHMAAFIDGRGGVEAASAGFDLLGFSQRTLADFAAESGRSGRRLVKKIIPARDAALPAGIARLRDEPARHLLVVIDERRTARSDERAPAKPVPAPQEPPRVAAQPSLPLAPVVQVGPASPPEPPVTEAEPPPVPVVQVVPALPPETVVIHTEPPVVPLEVFQAQRPSPLQVELPLPVAPDIAAELGALEVPVEATPPPEAGAPEEFEPLLEEAISEAIASPAGELIEQIDEDELPLTVEEGDTPEPADIADAEDDGGPMPAAPTASVMPPDAADPWTDPAPDVAETDRAASALRFVWRTDADGQFKTISPEFLIAVGANPANIVGRPFKDVSEEFGLDPYGEIAGLLERRDTWSGRSVLWPITGTDLRVPVDLAALPVYARDRSFEGFRGFGVARMADAVVDSDAGKARRDAPIAEGADELLAPIEPGGDFPAEGDPFRGEAPALTIVQRADRRLTDKVIRLAEHRSLGPEKMLSTGERSAFREIGDRLRTDGGEATVLAAAEVDFRATTPVAPSYPVEAPPQAMPILDEPAYEVPAGVPADIADDHPPEPLVQDELELTEEFSVLESGGIEEHVPEEPDQEEPAEVARVETPVASTAPPVAAPVEPPRVAEPAKIARPSSADLLVEGFLPSAFSGPSAIPRKPIQDTPILSRLPVPLLVHSGDVLHYANDEFLSLTGYDTVEQLAEAGGLGALFSERYDEDSTPDGDDRAIRMKTRDGLEFAIEALLRSVPWNGSKALMLVVRRTGEDEPDEVPASPIVQPAASLPVADDASVDTAALKARVAEMRTIIDTATDGVILIAKDGTIRSISRPAEALFGFETDDLNGKPFVSLFAIESQRSARDYLAGLSDNGVASVLNDGREVIGREAQGRFIPLFMSIGRLPGDSGYCAVVRDITQWKRAEEELTQAKAVAERASSQKTDFLARVSHEIRTPLNAIIGFSELMVDERFGPIANERYRDYLRDINRSGNHVLDLVNDLLDISKIEAGEQEMANEAVSLNETLAETVAMMQPQANRERVIIRSSFASRLPEVVADLRSVRQIALNILANAIRYTQAGGQVIVSTSFELSGDVVMRVRDTGIGMSAAEIEQAMKPFRQINALKRGRGDGTGLGLPLTKAMVEANRARFAINSSPGDGTLVEVIFPATRVLSE